MRKKFYVLWCMIVLVHSLGCTKKSSDYQEPDKQPSSKAEVKVDSNLSVERTADVKRSSESSIKISGVSKVGDWQYAKLASLPIKEGKRYSLSVWMYIDQVSLRDKLPYFDVAISENGKFLNGIGASSEGVELKKWINYTLEFDGVGAGSHIATVQLVKGSADIQQNIVVYIDQLEFKEKN